MANTAISACTASMPTRRSRICRPRRRSMPNGRSSNICATSAAPRPATGWRRITTRSASEPTLDLSDDAGDRHRPKRPQGARQRGSANSCRPDEAGGGAEAVTRVEDRSGPERCSSTDPDQPRARRRAARRDRRSRIFMPSSPSSSRSASSVGRQAARAEIDPVARRLARRSPPPAGRPSALRQRRGEIAGEAVLHVEDFGAMRRIAAIVCIMRDQRVVDRRHHALGERPVARRARRARCSTELSQQHRADGAVDLRLVLEQQIERRPRHLGGARDVVHRGARE